MNIVHLVEQHVSMDLTQGMREVLLCEAFSGPIHGLHTFEKPVQNTGTTISIICDWYLENVVKDVNGAGILFTPIDKCFKSARPVGGYFAEAVTDLSELKAFVRLFGPYGVDKLDGIIREHLTALLSCIDTTLRSNKEYLEALSARMHNWRERDYYLKQVHELEPLINFSIQVGQALCFSSLLAEAAGQVLDANTPLLFSLLSDLFGS
jgi:NCK-associated protein 1